MLRRTRAHNKGRARREGRASRGGRERYRGRARHGGRRREGRARRGGEQDERAGREGPSARARALRMTGADPPATPGPKKRRVRARPRQDPEEGAHQRRGSRGLGGAGGGACRLSVEGALGEGALGEGGAPPQALPHAFAACAAASHNVASSGIAAPRGLVPRPASGVAASCGRGAPRALAARPASEAPQRAVRVARSAGAARPAASLCGGSADSRGKSAAPGPMHGSPRSGAHAGGPGRGAERMQSATRTAQWPERAAQRRAKMPPRCSPATS